jgi:hypothetical protein
MRGTCAPTSAQAIARAGLCAAVFGAALSSAPLSAQEDSEDDSGSYESDEPALEVNGMLRMQGGVFAPLFSDKFKPHENLAGFTTPSGNPNPQMPCDPVTIQTLQCLPYDHGQKPGSPSIARATFQLEAQWNISDKVGLHAIVRAVRSLQLPADEYAQIPAPHPDPALRKDYAERWAHDNYYQELDLREFYLDLTPKSWLSFRIGRQQVAWGDTGQYRLLDVVNPQNNTWHFAPLEAIEDTRIPLWMWLTTIDMPEIDHSLELLWIPLIDRPKDTVHTPISFVGAWGLPYTNAPTSFYMERREFRYPGQRLEDQRAGLRWKGNLGAHTSYSLVYMYTHQLGPPVPLYYEQKPLATGGFDSSNASVAVLTFPRQHIAGFTLEQLIDPLAMIARLEAAFEPNRTYPGDTRTTHPVPEHGNRYFFYKNVEMAVSYAAVLQRPTMIRFLNPTQNFLLIAQFMHTAVPTLTEDDVKTGYLREVPGYNKWEAQKHSYRVIFAARTNYLNGKITLGLTGAYIPNPYADDSGFYSIDLGFRFGPHYRLNVTATDFFGKDPYRDLGLFRDRDELHAALSVLF